MFPVIKTKHLYLSLIFNKFIKKETLAQVFSYEPSEISKNTFSTEHLWATIKFPSVKNPQNQNSLAKIPHHNCNVDINGINDDINTKKQSRWVLARSHCRSFFKKKVLLNISQNSQENTCSRVSFLIKL